MIESIGLFDNTFAHLERSLEIAARRQEVISQNIANAKTPGYEALTFDEQLMRAVTRQENRSVNLEEELAALTTNSLQYSSYVKLLSARLNVLKTIATQGRR